MVGIRGLMDVKHIQAAFAFLNIPSREWRTGVTVENAVLASVKAFSFLHRIQYAARLAVTKGAVRWENESNFDQEEVGRDELASTKSEDNEAEGGFGQPPCDD